MHSVLSDLDHERDLRGLRVALVGPMPPPNGGIANQTKQLAMLLAGEGVEVEVVRNNEPYRPVWIGRIRGVRAIFRLVFFVRALWCTIGQTDCIHVMANSGWAWHLFTAPAVWIAWLKNRPVMINYRGGGAQRFFDRSWWLVHPTLRLARVVTVPSDYLREIFRKRGIDTVIVPNIINLDRFSLNGRWQLDWSALSGAWPHIIVTRNLEPIYDVGTALQAFKPVLERYPDAFMTIAGTGPELGSLKRLSEQLAISKSIRFAGRLNNDEIAALYQTADLLVNSSLVDNMPISILEALASGVPIVSTNAGGIPYMVSSGEDALLVEPGDAKVMAKSILMILADRHLAWRMISTGSVTAARYKWASVKQDLFQVYRSLLAMDTESPVSNESNQ